MNHILFKIVFIGLTVLNFFKCDRVSPIVGKLRKRDINLTTIKNDWNSFLNFLNPIAIKRISGTPEIETVKSYIANQMKSYGWIVEYDTFNDQTPYGQKSFTNIITTLPIGTTYKNINSINSIDKTKINHVNNRVVIACHYDSKYFEKGTFIGAIDSAVPCAMMLDLAKYLKDYVLNDPSISYLTRYLQFMFFDGEEAFVRWTATDSLYGSRHYADLLNKNYSTKAFDTIDLFVLLDLIGGDQSQFLNYFPQTSHVYSLMSKIESVLIKKKLLFKKQPYFFPDLNGYNGVYSQIEDDHKPFLKYGVPVLHLIPSPFPTQWHELTDTVENLNKNNIQDLRLIMKYFIAEVLHVNTRF